MERRSKGSRGGEGRSETSVPTWSGRKSEPNALKYSKNRGHLGHVSEDHQVGEKYWTILAVFVRVFGTLWESVLQAI